LTDEIDPFPWGDLTRFRVYAECLTDAKKNRVSTENRVLRGGTWEEGMAEEVLAVARSQETSYERMLLSAYQRLVPQEVQNWAKGIPGIASGELFARLLGTLGHPRVAIPMRWEGSDLVPDGPPRHRTVRQLWSYCGCGDPLRNPRKDILGHSPTREDVLAGGKRNTVRPLLFMFTSYLVRAHTRSEAVGSSEFYQLLAATKTAARGHEEDCSKGTWPTECAGTHKVHQRQCQNKSIPPNRPNGCGTVAHPEWGAPGSPWRPGHIDMHAHRIVAKAFLKELWRVSE